MKSNLTPKEWKKKARIKIKKRCLYSIHDNFVQREPIGIVSNIRFNNDKIINLYQGKPIYYIGTCVDNDGLVRPLGYHKPYSEDIISNYSTFIYLGYIEINCNGVSKLITENDILKAKPLYNGIKYFL
jgi:hypothetical protein